MLRVGVIMYQTSQSKGQELVAQRMVREFRAQGYDAFLITSAYHDGQVVVSEEEIAKHGGYVYSFDERLGIPLIRVGAVGTSWPPRRISLSDFITTLGQIVDAQKLNVLIVHSTLWNGPEDVLKFVEWRRNLTKDGFPELTPIFCHMSHFQEASPERYDVVERSFREAWNSTSLAQVVKAADLVLVVSPYEKQVMKDLGADESKILLFPGGIDDLADSTQSVPAFQQKHNIPAGAVIVTSLGTVEERKNTMAVVEVAKRLVGRPVIHFVIAGREEGEYAQKVRESARALANVSMIGPISDDEKSDLIRSTSINIIMSRSEALGIAQLEFMSNSIPVVTSGIGGQAWLVKDGEDGFVVAGPDDIEGAASAISRIAENESLRKRLGNNARRRASAYSMSRLISDLAKRLNEMWEQRSEEDRLRRGLPEREEIIEAMVSGDMRVMVTNRRLMVKDDRASGDPISVSFKSIRRVVRTTLYPWYVLAGGAVITAGFLASTVFPPWLRVLGDLFRFTPLDGISAAIPAVVALGATGLIFWRLRRKGYFVETLTGRIFVPGEFLRLLKLVDRMTATDLFSGLE